MARGSFFAGIMTSICFGGSPLRGVGSAGLRTGCPADPAEADAHGICIIYDGLYVPQRFQHE